MSHWPGPFFELVVVLAFGCGWAILEWKCKQLDKERDRDDQKAAKIE